MKIDRNIKYEQLPYYVKEHLMFFFPSHKNSLVFGFTFVMIDLLVAVPLFYPKNNILLSLILPPLLFLHAWAIRLFIKNAYSIQLELVLFIGWMGAIGSYTYILLSYKMAYYFIGVTNIYYYIVCSLTYLIAVIILIVYQIKKYSNIRPLHYKERKAEEAKRDKIMQYSSVAAIFPALGYIIAHRWLLKSDELGQITLVVISYIFSIVLAYLGAKFFHRYFFIKANPDFVIFARPTKKEKREMRKKGKEIIIK